YTHPIAEPYDRTGINHPTVPKSFDGLYMSRPAAAGINRGCESRLPPAPGRVRRLPRPARPLRQGPGGVRARGGAHAQGLKRALLLERARGCAGGSTSPDPGDGRLTAAILVLGDRMV